MKVGGSAADVVVSVGTVWCLVATSTPASSLHEAGGVILRSMPDRVGIDHTAGRRSLKVTAEAKIGIASDEHSLIHRAVWVMAGGAAFFHRTVLINEWSLLSRVALRAGLVLTFHRNTHALDGIARVDVMAIYAGNLACEHGVSVGETEFAALLEMAGEAGFRRFAGIDNGALGATALDVRAARAVTSFATRRTNARIGEGQFGVR